MATRLSQPKRFRRWIVASILACASLPGTLPAQQELSGSGAASGLPPGVREQLQKNAAAMSAAHLEYSKAQAGKIPDSYGGPAEYYAYFDSGRFYQRRLTLERHPTGEVLNQGHEDAFDGNIFYFGDPDLPFSGGGRSTGDLTGTLVKFSVDDALDPERTATNKMDFPYLDAAGFYVARTIADLAARSPVESLVLHQIDESTSSRVEPVEERLRVTVQVPDRMLIRVQQLDLAEVRKVWESGRNSAQVIRKEMEALRKMQEMAPTRTVAYLLDPDYGCGVVEREEWTADGKRIVHAVADQWRHYEATDIWLPSRCVESYYTYPSAPVEFASQPMLTFTIQLHRVEFGQQDKVAFALDYKKAGNLIRDRSSPEARKSPDHEVQYMISADGTALRNAAAEALKEMEGGGAHLWLWVNLGVLAAIGIVFLVVRVARRAQHGESK